MKPRPPGGRLLQALDAEVQRRGYGAPAALSAAMGRHRGWWADRVRRGALTTEQLEDVVEHLGLDLPALLCEAYDVTAPGFHRPQGTAPDLVRIAWERDLDGPTDGLGLAFVAAVDEERYRDPHSAADQAAWGLPRAAQEAIPALLGVAGSASRRLLRLEESEHLICTGIALAARHDAPAGDLYQRLAYLYSSRGKFKTALRLAAHAANLHLLVGDAVGAAKAVVDQSVWLFANGEYEKCLKAACSVLPQLPSDARRNRTAAWQYQSLAYAALDRLDDADSAFGAAQAEARELDQESRIKLQWLGASLRARRGLFLDAADALEPVVAFFVSHHPGEAALAGCDLVMAQLQAGHQRDAIRSVDMLLGLVEPLRGYERISEALRILTAAENLGLTLEAVTQAIRLLRSVRGRPGQWPAPPRRSLS